MTSFYSTAGCHGNMMAKGKYEARVIGNKSKLKFEKKFFSRKSSSFVKAALD